MAGVFIFIAACGVHSFYILFWYLQTPYKMKKCIFGVYGWCVHFVVAKYILILYKSLILTAGFNILYLPTGFKTYSFIF